MLVPTRTHPGPSSASEISSSLLFRSQGLLQEFLNLIDVRLHVPVESQEGRMRARGQVVQVGWLSAERSRFRRWLTSGRLTFGATCDLSTTLPGPSSLSVGRTDVWWGGVGQGRVETVLNGCGVTASMSGGSHESKSRVLPKNQKGMAGGRLNERQDVNTQGGGWALLSKVPSPLSLTKMHCTESQALAL